MLRTEIEVLFIMVRYPVCIYFVLLCLLPAIALQAATGINKSAETPKNYSKVDGPNCLNAAMVSVGLSKTIRYASNGEMKTMLDSPLCRRLKNTEQRQANDIGVIWDNGFYANKNIFSHAFVMMNDTEVYEKHGYSKTDPYQIIDLSTVMSQYDVTPNQVCRANQSNRFSCRMGTDFYRCQGLDTFIKEKKTQIRFHTLSFFRILEKIEFKLQDYLAHIQQVENKNKHLEIVRDLQSLARKMLNIPKSTVTEENLMFKIVAHRFVSIAGQLSAVGYSDLRQAVWQWENEDKNIGDVFEAVLKLQVEDDLDLVYANIRSKFFSIYAPIIKIERHVNLKILLNKELPEVAAGVSLHKETAVIEMGNDIHRQSAMTADAYAAMLCHEMGHLLGGKPFSANTLKPTLVWVSSTPSSSEGQSDYFSATCLKNMFSADKEFDVSKIAVSARIINLCAAKYLNVADEIICLRSVKSGFELMVYIASIYEQFGPNSNMPRPNMDLTEADGVSANGMYPTLQCRFDTFVAGALQQKQPGCWYK